MLQGPKDENISSVDTFGHLQKIPPDLIAYSTNFSKAERINSSRLIFPDANLSWLPVSSPFDKASNQSHRRID